MKARELAPVAPQARERVELRATLTPFAQQLATALEPTPTNERGVRVRIIPAAEAARVLPRICDRQGLTGKPFTYLRQADGRLSSSWADAPTIWVNQWTSREGAIVLIEDVDGPSEMRFVTQIATDTVKTVMRIGNAGVESLPLARAYWDLGIRRYVAEVTASLVPIISSPERLERLTATGLTMQLIDRGTVFEQISTRMDRP